MNIISKTKGSDLSMKKKLLLISCIAAIGMSLVACGDGNSSSSASSSKAEATLSVASSTEDSNASSEDVPDTVNADSAEDGRVTDGTESDIPEIDEPVSAEGDNEQTVTAKEYIEKMVNNVKDNKNVHIESTVDTSVEMAADQQNISFTNKSKISADSTIIATKMFSAMLSALLSRGEPSSTFIESIFSFRYCSDLPLYFLRRYLSSFKSKSTPV